MADLGALAAEVVDDADAAMGDDVCFADQADVSTARFARVEAKHAKEATLTLQLYRVLPGESTWTS